MNLEQYKLQLKKQLTEDIESVIFNLSSKTKQNTDIYDSLIIVNAKFKKLRRSQINGTINHSNVELETNKTIESLISIINEIRHNDLNTKFLSKQPIKLKEYENNLAKRHDKYNKKNWNKLIQIGEWEIGGITGNIIGQGVYKYLLSEKEYGNRNFVITAKVEFEKMGNHSFNAGFILGWVENDDLPNRYYYNILLTGKKITFEGIGLYGGDDLNDFTHLSEGNNFDLRFGILYEFTINSFKDTITVFIDSIPILSVKKPENMIGKVGLRPWRSSMSLKSFYIHET